MGIEKLITFIESLKTNSKVSSFDEAAIKQGVILRLFDLLGWNIYDYYEVAPEFSLEGKRVDYALCIGNINTVFIEVKNPSVDLEKHQKQLFDYSFTIGVELAALTNGLAWWFYLTTKNRGLKFYTIDIAHQDSKDVASKFIALLSKDNVQSGQSKEYAKSIYSGHVRKFEIEKTTSRKEIIEDTSEYERFNTPEEGQQIIPEVFIDKFKKALHSKTERTKETYFIYVNKFLVFSGGDLSSEKVILFLRREVSRNSCPTAYSAIRFFYEAAEIPFDVKRDDVVSNSIKKSRESLTPDEIKQMITESKKHVGKVDIGFLAAFTNPVFGAVEIGYLLLSTVYGLKRTEIYDITSDAIDIDNSHICIKPVKTTDIEKNHIIQVEIAPIMRNFKTGLKKMKNKPPILHYTYLFDGMCSDAGVALRPRLGWESIRRTLECELAMAGVNETVIKSFMGMKTRGTELLLKGNWKRVDEAVFEKHPFLRSWE